MSLFGNAPFIMEGVWNPLQAKQKTDDLLKKYELESADEPKRPELPEVEEVPKRRNEVDDRGPSISEMMMDFDRAGSKSDRRGESKATVPAWEPPVHVNCFPFQLYLILTKLIILGLEPSSPLSRFVSWTHHH